MDQGSRKRIVNLFTLATLATMLTPGLAFAEGTAIGSSSFSGVISALTGQISVTTVVEVLTYIAGIVVALVFMWWGVRKATHALMTAFRKGRVSI